MRKVKSLTALLLSVALVFTLAGCGEVKKAEDTVKGMLDSVKAYDIEAMGEYIGKEEIGEYFAEEIAFILEAVFKNVEYELVSSEAVDGEKVVVTAKITTTDMHPVMKDFMMDLMQYAFEAALSGASPSDEEVQAKMVELYDACMAEPDLATVTKEVVITVTENEDGEWKIEGTEELFTAISGDIMKAFEAASDENNLG